jgi:thiamine biosynthesis protein ThiI
VSSVVVHYAELALKGRNRPWFINTLVRTIREALADQDVVRVQPLMGRIGIQLGPRAEWQAIRERLAHLPGIGNFSRATHTTADVEAIGAGVIEGLATVPPVKVASFRISARRADKRFPIPSPEIERVIGRKVQDATGWKVDLSHPELTIHVEVLSKDAFFFFGKEPGPGGLPVGTSGRVMSLLSGGIDSPVASWRMIRRGCRAHFVHFHSHPILSRTSQDKARELVEQLTRHQLRSRLYLIPFAPLQQRVVVTVPPALRVVVYRRLMVRIAQRLARHAGAHALVTGDVVGQVASQTIDNISVIDEAATMPILRPLVGFDKEEITIEAQRLGTYEISVVPDEDCCRLFTPQYPATRASLASVQSAEAELDVDALIAGAIEAAAVEEFRFPVLRLAAPTIDRGDVQ